MEADPSPFRERLERAPEVAVVALLGGWRLDAEYLTALRIDPGHHVLEGPVLSRRTHGLEDFTPIDRRRFSEGPARTPLAPRSLALDPVLKLLPQELARVLVREPGIHEGEEILLALRDGERDGASTSRRLRTRSRTSWT